MGSIHLINASAGTGKTTRLARELRDAIVSGVARADAIVGVTFTNKAAAELVERARQVLLAAGAVDAANRLLSSRVGTVHSVCGRLVAEWSLLLGLSTDLIVLGERDAMLGMRSAISSVLTREERDELERLTERMPRLAWQEAVRHLIQCARTNRIDPASFDECARQSVQEVLGYFGEATLSAEEIDQRLSAAIREFVDLPEVAQDRVKKTHAAVTRARKVLEKLERGEAPSWPDWVTLSRLDVSKKLDALAEPLRAAAVLHDQHPRLHRDLERATELVFQIAAKAYTSYQEWKRVHRAVDFVDQEVLALSLLEYEEVERTLRHEIDLFLVDEFQDTSPIQLELFLRIARLAKRTVWVGDPKQAIYGFRGTDPALMEAATGGLLETVDDELIASAIGRLEASSEHLATSYRSRPALVELTSNLFARVFATCGMPEEAVRIQADTTLEPVGLGPILEHWPLPDGDEPALSVARLLEDLKSGDVRVRDRETGAPRAARWKDIAVLCMTNKQCERIARSAAEVHVPVILARTGLLDTIEARFCLAALRLFLDPRDRLAATTIVRTADEAQDSWLHRARVDEDMIEHPALLAIRALARSHRHLDVKRAFDAVLFEADALERMAEYENAVERRANLDALRSLVHRYVESCEALGGFASVPGLLAHFSELRQPPPGSARVDERAVLGDQDAVAISTWHRAKGLEWPIVVLYGLEELREPDLFGVDARTDGGPFDPMHPLRGRGVRFWPIPYWGLQKHTPLRDRVTKSDAWRSVNERAAREQLRLLYVGWTRARDRLVLAAEEGKLYDGILGRVCEIDPDLLRGLPMHVRRAGSESAGVRETGCVEVYVRRERGTAPRDRYLAPSSIEERGTIASMEPIHRRIRIARGVDLEIAGRAVHGFLAADEMELPDPERVELARAVLQRWKIEGAIDPVDLAAMSAALHRWIRRKWPDARLHRESPILRRRAGGVILRGTADLIVESWRGIAIVDHKTFPGGREAALEHAASYAGQLGAYAEAVEAATGKPVLGTFIHLPISGWIARVTNRCSS